MQRVEQHPIIRIEERPCFYINFDGQDLLAREGETIAATLLAHGVRTFRHTEKYGEPRGMFCGIGQCTDCIMQVDGKPNVRSCVTLVKPGMVVKTQHGRGDGA